jgi:hypothetical protein
VLSRDAEKARWNKIKVALAYLIRAMGINRFMRTAILREVIPRCRDDSSSPRFQSVLRRNIDPERETSGRTLVSFQWSGPSHCARNELRTSPPQCYFIVYFCLLESATLEVVHDDEDNGKWPFLCVKLPRLILTACR